MHRKPLVSIVVPIYNIETYLPRCIESLLNQTYTHLEIILIDDGSSDGSGLICDAYQKRDERIIVIHKPNGGHSSARNSALDIATGEYIFCLDSDDYLTYGAIELLVASALDRNADISIGAFKLVYPSSSVDLQKIPENTPTCYTPEHALEELMYQRGITTSAWGKLYKRNLFESEKIRYPEGKICEDLPTTYRLFDRTTKIVANSAQIYFYFQRADSIINSPFKKGREEAIDAAFEELNFIKQKYPKIIKAAENRLFMEAVFILLCIGSSGKSLYLKEWQKASQVLKAYRKTVLFDKKSPQQYRIFALSSYISPHMVVAVDMSKKILKKMLHR